MDYGKATRSGEKLNAYLNRQQANGSLLSWKKSHFKCDKNRKIAWVKYYETEERYWDLARRNYEMWKQLNENFDLRDTDDDGIANNIQNEYFEMVAELKKEIECPICFEPILKKEDLHITSCGHKYCKDCRSRITDCAMCRKKIGVFKKK